jgi:hypothetical protein
LLDECKLFGDSTSRVIQGKRHKEYSVVDGVKLKVIESGRLPSNRLTQTCELFSIIFVLKDKEGAIYIDSKYAFGMAHTFGKI